MNSKQFSWFFQMGAVSSLKPNASGFSKYFSAECSRFLSRSGPASLFLRLAGALFISLSLAACSKGLDKKPDFTSQEAYTAQINKDLTDIGEAKKEAFNWSVQGVAFDDLRSRHLASTYRQIAESELDRKSTASKAQAAELQASIQTVVDDLLKIQAEVSNERIEKDFFGTQFKFDIKVNNTSSRDVSKIAWNASLFLDGSDTPVATSAEWSLYESTGGLKAGQVASQTIQVGSFNPPREWVNLTSLNAKTRKVVLKLRNVYDFNNQSYVDSSNVKLEALRQVPVIVEKLKLALSAPDVPVAKQVTQSSTQQVNRTSCTNQCTNGSCIRTFPDGTQEKWQAPRNLDPLTQNWGWDTTTNACGQ